MQALWVNSGTADNSNRGLERSPPRPHISPHSGAEPPPLAKRRPLIARYAWLGEVREGRAKPHDCENVRSSKNCRNEIRLLSLMPAPPVNSGTWIESKSKRATLQSGDIGRLNLPECYRACHRTRVMGAPPRRPCRYG